MNQLPKLKDFKAIEAEPEPPEPLWKRALGYLAISFFCGCALVGLELYQSFGLSTKKQDYKIRYAKPEERLEIIKKRASLWFMAGFAVPLIYFTAKELNRTNEN